MCQSYLQLPKLSPILAQEYKTIIAMTRLYCRDHHDSQQDVCSDCDEFLRFAHKRLQRCPYGEDKPTCQSCPIHCYGRRMREHAKTIMRYSGPRMLLRHPVMAIRHLLHDRKPLPPTPARYSRR